MQQKHYVMNSREIDSRTSPKPRIRWAEDKARYLHRCRRVHRCHFENRHRNHVREVLGTY